MGNELGEMLMRQKAKCLLCEKWIIFESGVKNAREKGIKDNVVMCGHCSSVFTVHIVPGKMTLITNVTEKYLTPEQIAEITTKFAYKKLNKLGNVPTPELTKEEIEQQKIAEQRRDEKWHKGCRTTMIVIIGLLGILFIITIVMLILEIRR